MVEQHDFPKHHPEWIQRDHMLVAWAYTHSSRAVQHPLGYLDLYGIPILTPELRKILGDEWHNWKEAQ